jgi:hypothetical protein
VSEYMLEEMFVLQWLYEYEIMYLSWLVLVWAMGNV